MRLLFWSAAVLVIVLCPRLYRWHALRRERLARISYGGKASAPESFPWVATLVTLAVVALFVLVVVTCGGAM